MIIPAILETDFAQIQKKIDIVDSLAQIVQIDIADGKLVEGTTFLDIQKFGQLKTRCPLEVHLMVENPTDFVKNRVKNVNTVISQVEAQNVSGFIQAARAHGYMVGLSISNTSSWRLVVPFVGQIDCVQFMTIKPGGQGRPFDNSVLPSITEFKAAYPLMTVQVDGGVDKINLAKVLKAGADNVVIGSEIFHSVRT